jgi:hypothetical protein
MATMSPTRKQAIRPSVRPTAVIGPLSREAGSRDRKNGSAIAVIVRMTGRKEAPYTMAAKTAAALAENGGGNSAVTLAGNTLSDASSDAPASSRKPTAYMTTKMRRKGEMARDR